MTPSTTDALPTCSWKLDDEGCWTIEGAHCRIWMQARPPYCDRGNWLAHIEPTTHDVRKLHLDDADRWPRYYFDLQRAKAEVEAWLIKRKEAV